MQRLGAGNHSCVCVASLGGLSFRCLRRRWHAVAAEATARKATVSAVAATPMTSMPAVPALASVAAVAAATAALPQVAAATAALPAFQRHDSYRAHRQVHPEN